MKRWAVIDWSAKDISLYDNEKEAEAHVLRMGDDGQKYCNIIDLYRVDTEPY